MEMDADDQKLSRAIAPPAQRQQDNEDLRTLMIQRISATWKVVGRVTLRRATMSVYCEQCRRWAKVRQLAEEYTCAGCDTVYVAELVIYEELEERKERLKAERQMRSSTRGS